MPRTPDPPASHGPVRKRSPQMGAPIPNRVDPLPNTQHQNGLTGRDDHGTVAHEQLVRRAEIHRTGQPRRPRFDMLIRHKMKSRLTSMAFQGNSVRSHLGT